MKKSLLILGIAVAGLFSSCDENLSDLNMDPKNPIEVKPEVLFTYGQYDLVNQMVNIDYNQNLDRLWANYLTQTTYIQESAYDAANRDVGGSLWDNIYAETLYELKQAKELLLSEEVADPNLVPVRNNQLAMVRVLEVYAYQYLVDNFGSIPYTEALDIDNVTPIYDEGEYVYGAIIDSLDVAINDFDDSAAGFSSSSDILYGGDIAAWKKFANSIKLKIGMRLADVNPSLAGTLVSEAVEAGVFESNTDNAVYAFSASQPYTNPIYDYFEVDSRDTDFVITQFFIDMLEGVNDPRMNVYFDDNIEDGYVGGEYGASGNSYLRLTHINPSLVEATFPGTILDYSYVSFLMAEAVERDFITGSAAEYYENGIRASFEAWGLSDTEATLYIAQPSVNYLTAAGDYKEKIGTQKYIALYNQGHEAWTEARRLDVPQLLTAVSNGVENPKRLIFPTNEPLINTTNYNAASDALGGDKTTSAIFWDLN
ncbi:SusD/RagB family nutrient-binding outer membrane lipoprotein [Echinicola marina]|uniref:SusD/RagB family nutrient-binding outer membrane lipoprotein n=1 Tax=Echinicola marina TaxID=2859768 RepID=UPI001CF6E0AA|nr:SusD/RagB family nutrient-binding outer membrane lipoprotein [Echinicola marina]UCS94229.1 SusD/RagB family nutrient-binding outer membrane lipoprotein [Echinicola marina]